MITMPVCAVDIYDGESSTIRTLARAISHYDSYKQAEVERWIRRFGKIELIEDETTCNDSEAK